MKDFEPVVYTHVVPLLLAVHPSVGAKNVQELAAWIRANPAESGLNGYDASTWGGILAPARTPKEAVAKLNSSINAALKMDDVRSRLVSAGIEIQGGTPGEFAGVIQAEVDKWGRIVKEAGIQPE